MRRSLARCMWPRDATITSAAAWARASSKTRRHATHEDILFAPHKTPEINLNGAWMHKDGKEVLLIKDYQPTEFVKQVAL